MSYYILSFIAVLIFAFVHLCADRIRRYNVTFHRKILYAGAGVAISYVFLDILPKISKNDPIVTKALQSLFPYIERHAYLTALAGFLLFFIVDRSKKIIQNRSTFYWLSLSSYALLNFMIGYAIVDKNNPEVRPLAFFTFAIALHFFMNDYSLTENHGDLYRKKGRWILISCLFLGWVAGASFQISTTVIGLVSAFIGGGVIMNVTRNELSSCEQTNLRDFLFGTIVYTIILLTIGGHK